MRKTFTAAELADMDDLILNEVMVGVMGWRMVFDRLQGDWRVRSGRCTDRGSLMYWCPASDWSSCGLVIDRMLNRGADISLYLTAARIRPAPELRSIYIKPAATTMRAICEAAVLATQAWRAARKPRFPKLYRDNGKPYCWHYLTGKVGQRHWRNMTDRAFRKIATPAEIEAAQEN